ncbi:MAG: flagellar hook-basal body complex protein FliE [Mizugakiibacter sp.]|uniref:flagellar hook-basal body complex protein FliE n=1 Tax=Mizugakiibacter sp. TaxID=1972610 RepID=UPI0031BF17EF|nr:flagellar hook-basal body complex protein FliE [Xanthomonadaceae bacterium]
MSQIDINGLLTQMRGLAAQAGGPFAAAGAANVEAPAAGRQDFGALLKQAVGGVEETQRSAGQLATAFERGDPRADLGQVMVALQKADLSFRTMTEVRNKLVDAYKDIMNMPV